MGLKSTPVNIQCCHKKAWQTGKVIKCLQSEGDDKEDRSCRVEIRVPSVIVLEPAALPGSVILLSCS